MNKTSHHFAGEVYASFKENEEPLCRALGKGTKTSV